jgi:hypothetical protein
VLYHKTGTPLNELQAQIGKFKSPMTFTKNTQMHTMCAAWNTTDKTLSLAIDDDDLGAPFPAVFNANVGPVMFGVNKNTLIEPLYAYIGKGAMTARIVTNEDWRLFADAQVVNTAAVSTYATMENAIPGKPEVCGFAAAPRADPQGAIDDNYSDGSAVVDLVLANTYTSKFSIGFDQNAMYGATTAEITIIGAPETSYIGTWSSGMVYQVIDTALCQWIKSKVEDRDGSWRMSFSFRPVL